MLGRFRDWRFRDKVLAVTALPAVLATLLFSAAFFAGLERVWRDAVPTQAALQRFDSLSREFQSEVREYVLLPLPETTSEVAEIEHEFAAVLADLSARRQTAALAAELAAAVDTLVDQGKHLFALARSRSSGDPLSEELELELERLEALEVLLESRVDVERRASERHVEAAFRRFTWFMLASGGVALALAAVVASALGRWFEGPIGVLQQAGERILDGDFRARELIESRDELGQLAAGFDRGAAEIRRLLAEERDHLDSLKRHQDQLLQSGKMAAVGELAAGVAHEINNPLSAVLTYGVLLREKAEAAPPEVLEHLPKLVERLRLIEGAALRCKGIAEKLLTFSRRDDAAFSSVRLGEVIDDALELMGVMLRRRGLAVERRFASSLPAVWGNASQLGQVLVNLLANAIHAAPEGGRVVVAARQVEGRCELVVEDDGAGIPAHLKDRIFEPFVTTKPTGEGTGLGLSIVYGIVEAHDGRVRVNSEPGHTVFTVELPVAQG